ncbi:hypothetical protein CAC42_1841 [Sphaceloma murrayae]|uniref:Uncharacterized protein n=1 Tax=Sphaceloma murrayae TaxID=2082308 RepID=A0A2K1QVM1_9PEZI|nr:hypothetical protein CAC42_1841 [Sphaceloma murrayae]
MTESFNTKRNRLDPTLRQRIDRLRLPLAPLMPMPQGDPHPDFPATLLAFHLLTEGQLDRLAHHYHQSTPGFWTDHYPVSILWPRRGSDSLLSPRTPRLTRRASTGSSTIANQSLDASIPPSLAELASDQDWLTSLLASASTTHPTNDSPPSPEQGRRWSALLRDDITRIAIKRRKIGKFIGLVGMETPAAEVESRMRHDLERAARVVRRDRRKREDEEMARGKWR